MDMEKSIVGDLINFRGLVYSPVGEQGVVFLFGKVAGDLNMYVEEIRSAYPDCVARRFAGKGWERIYIEFEYKSKNFSDHGHDPSQCNMIVCWEHDWPECPLEIVELKEVIKELPNQPVGRPDVTRGPEGDLKEHYKRASGRIVALYEKLHSELSAADEEIFRKIAKGPLTYYSPQRVFIYANLQKQQIRLQIYLGPEDLEGVKRVSAPDGTPLRWGKIYLRRDDQLDKIMLVLRESLARIRQAVRNNENTGWFTTVSGETYAGPAPAEELEGEGEEVGPASEQAAPLAGP